MTGKYTIGEINKTWKECIIDALTFRHGPDGQMLWYTHGKMLDVIYDRNDLCEERQPRRSMTRSLLQLIKTGHVQRAHKPIHLYHRHYAQREYIYRSTGKVYDISKRWDKSPPAVRDSERTQGRILKSLKTYHKYPKLPLWYRRLMY